MQDRFKFRVWHKKRKKMYEVLHLHTETLTNGGEWVTAKGFNIITQQDIHIQIEPKDGLIMQCTGLKDKNGKLIYEGDIVNIKYIRPDGFEIRKKCKIEFGYYSFWLYYKCGASLLYQEDCTYEIIGNIYENPELWEV